MNPTPRPKQKTGLAAAAPTRSNADGAQHTAVPPPAGGSLILAAGQRPLPDYELVGLLGRGGFGEVWKARGPGGFDVALKFVHLGEAAGDVELRALEVMKGIRHPNLLPLFGAWQRDGMLVVAMELADGTLLDRLRQARAQGLPGVPRDELLEHLRDAARGLDFLNDYRAPTESGGRPVGVQHKDVKPQNLLLVGGAVKVADFGLAKVLEHSVTAISGGLTPSYAAPEFFNGQATRWSDQYCLAVAYCELRGGKLPFEGSVLQIMAGHSLHPPDLSMLPDEERPAVARALAKKPDERWPSCRAFAEALTEATRTTPPPPAAPAPAPNPADTETRSRQEAEAQLARRYREALERTGGKLTAADRDALAGLYREHGISIERAGTITREVRARWREDQSGPGDRGRPSRPSSRRTPPPAGSPSTPGRRGLGGRARAGLLAVTAWCPRLARQGLGGCVRALTWLLAGASRCRRAVWQRLFGQGVSLPWLLAFALPLAGAAVIGLVLLAALYRSPTGEHPQPYAASTAPEESSTVTAVIRDTGRSPEPKATTRDSSPATPKEVPKPSSPTPQQEVPKEPSPPPQQEVPKPPTPSPRPRAEGDPRAPLDCTGPEGVTAAEVRQAQEAWAKYLGRPVEETVEIAPGVQMTFVLVPPGMFRMGSPEDEKDRSSDETLHVVTLTEPFDLGKTEVTQAQYRALTGKAPSEFKGPELPVETVSWDEARDCAERLTRKLAGRHLVRLPTEAEWEYACRGGRPSSQPFGVGNGRALSSREANCDGNYPYGGADKGDFLKQTRRVGSYPANALGLFDMHGNVEEWCADRHASYPSESSTNPAGPSEGTERIIRGGNWDDTPGGCRAANRSWGGPETRSNRVGFRLARSVSPGGK